MERWTLQSGEETQTFDGGEELLRHIQEEMLRLIGGSPLARLEIRDAEGKVYELSIDLSLEPRD